MKRKAPLRSKTPLKRGRLKPVSDKRRSRHDDRIDAKMAVALRDRGRCQGPEGHECGGALDVHEIIPRSAWPDGIYDADNCILICRRFHEWVTDWSTPAEERGFHVKRSTLDRLGRERALEQAAARRAGRTG